MWNGLFHAVSAFNNAGFSTYSDSLMGFVADPLVLVPIMLAVVLGGIGFPVLYEMRRERGGWRRWSIHTRITLSGTALLLVGGTLMIALYEWNNAATLGALGTDAKLLGALGDRPEAVLLRNAGHPDITGDVGYYQHHFVAGHRGDHDFPPDFASYRRVTGTVKMLKRRGRSEGSASHGVQPQGPEAPETVPLREEVEPVAVRGPARHPVIGRSVCDRDPLAFLRRCIATQRRDKERGRRSIAESGEGDPAIIGGEGRIERPEF